MEIAQGQKHCQKNKKKIPQPSFPLAKGNPEILNKKQELSTTPHLHPLQV